MSKNFHNELCIIAEKWLKRIGCSVTTNHNFKAIAYSEEVENLLKMPYNAIIENNELKSSLRFFRNNDIFLIESNFYSIYTRGNDNES